MELALPEADATALLRRPRDTGDFVPGRRRGVPLLIDWHDDAAGSLRAAGLVAAERREGRGLTWRLERMRPMDEACAPGGTPEPIENVAATAAALELPASLAVVASFSGMLHALRPAEDAGWSAVLLQGELRAAGEVRPACRLMLSGQAPAVRALALRLAETIRLQVPEHALAAEAAMMARLPIPPRRLGPPILPPDAARMTATAACRHVAAHLSDVIQHHARRIGADKPEAVHQVRVATRRLRATLALFRPVAGGEGAALRSGLQEMAHALGPARDWDVFLAETGRLVAKEFAGEPAVRRLLAAAERRRTACYVDLAAYLAGPRFRLLGIALVAFAATPGDDAPPDEDRDLRVYAVQALDRRLARVVKPGADVAGLPVEALHAIRLRAKRLRYAAEIFAPLFPPRRTKRFLRRLQRLQERLGMLNDGAVAAGLMAELGAAGRGFAAGAVRGMVAARASDDRAKIADSLRKLKQISPFWN